LNITTFHKRVLNLNVLRLFYFLKKEYNITIFKVINKKTGYKLFNILKSPVQYKIARNQLTLVQYKTSLYISFKWYKNNRSAQALINFIFVYIGFKISSNMINSNSVWRLTKLFRV